MFSHLRRIAISLVFLFGVAMLAIVIDSVGAEMVQVNYEYGVDDGPFALPFTMAESLMWMIIAAFIVGIALWILIGPIQETRREEEMRRLR